MDGEKKKIKLRKRILWAFSGVLFVSYALTAVIFNIALSVVPDAQGYYHAIEGGLRRPGIILFALVGVMFLVTVAATYFLSNSITKPIEKLGKFARGIGPGSFTQNEFEFKDKELSDLNNALNKTVKQLGEYDSHQKTFFQNASHELRTPLMSIKCYAEGINFGLMESKAAAETILSETDRLTELVSDLLYISKIDNITAEFSAEKADVAAIIRQCAARQQAMADKRQIAFSYDFDDDEVHCECVAELLTRAIDNLISNALRYAKTEVTLGCRKTADGVVITVADDGNGIEDAVMPHVFERFIKGTDGNTGIGLAIVKSVIDQHGGRIKAENRGGATFTVLLPGGYDGHTF